MPQSILQQRFPPRSPVPFTPVFSGRSASAGGSIGFLIVATFLFFTSSRILDFYGASLHLPLVLSLIAMFLAVIGGRVIKVIVSPIGIWLLAMSLWFLLSVPFSVWLGGSLGLISDQWSKSYTLFVVLGSLVASTRQTFKAIWAYAWAILLACALGLVIGESRLGRLALPSGSYGNPNDYGLALGMGLFCWWAINFNPQYKLVTRLFALVCLVLALMLLVRTGSRGVMFGIVAAFPWLLKEYSAMGRIRILVSSGIMFLAIVAFSPGAILDRFVTIWSPSSSSASADDATLSDEAAGSTESRLYLLKQSIVLTFQHPVLGVGVGMFAVAENSLAAASQQKGNWHETHNVYTEISSETGIPGLVFYILLLVACWRALSRVQRQNLPGFHPDYLQVKAAAAGLRLILVSIIVSGFFSPFAYTTLVPTMAALVYSLSDSFHREAALLHAPTTGESPVGAV